MENYENKWNELLQAAVMEQGLILRAYSAFHNYSLSNQIAAMVQCRIRGIEPSPINTYQGWQGLKRQVKKGEKAIWLCMPLTGKRQDDSGEDQMFIKAFVWKPRWFVLAQTEGEAVEMPAIPTWDKETALSNLQISEIDFDMLNGNVQGYASKRNIAISPVAAMPHKTLFHELAHVVLGHTIESDFQDTEQTPKNLREVEAESVALLLCESLGLQGAEYCRGYIQNWLQADVIPEKSAQKILGAADRILKAGRKEQPTNH
jgi:antirestriction protein ArdC